MNLALHGFLLQVLVSILFQHGFLLCSAGEPGYLDFDNLPETNFSCQGKVIGGYYADVEAGCQMFHVCTIGQKDEIMDIKFLCLNGTVFDQETRVCERVDEVDCSKSERFYNLNLELYGNNAVTLSLHDNNDDEENSSDSLEDHQQRTTSARPTTTTTASTTTSRPSKPSTASPNNAFQHPTGYPQHYQPQPPFPQVHTSQSKSLYDDKNGGYHHQYIFHNGERANNQATSFQLFSNQGVSSTTVQVPQIHQIRYSSTPSPQIIHNEPSTVSPLYHTSSTIQTLLNGNGNGPAIINPIFHNHGIASTTEQFTVHSNNPRETSEYRDNGDREQNIRPLEAVQSTNQGKVSKLTISPVPTSQEPSRIVQTKISQSSQSQQRLQGNFLPTPATIETTIRSFYPTPRTSPKPTSSNGQVTHIHVSPPVPIPQLKPHQITINLPPPDIQRIVQNPSPLLPSQSRVIVTAKASVSDESGRPLNTSQLVTLPLPTIPASYDDYKEGDVSFDPFYRDVPKIRSARSSIKIDDNEVLKILRRKRSPPEVRRKRSPDTVIGRFHYGADNGANSKTDVDGRNGQGEKEHNVESSYDDLRDFGSIKAELMKFRQILFGGELPQDFDGNFARPSESVDEKGRKKEEETVKKEKGPIEANSIGPKSNINHRVTFVKDLQVKASKHLSPVESEDEDYEIDEDDPASDADKAEKDGESDESPFEEFDPETDVDGEGKEESESVVEKEATEKVISSEKDDESGVRPTNSSPDDDADDSDLEATTILNDSANSKAEDQNESQHSLERHGTAESEGILSSVGVKEKEADAEESTESGIVIDLKLPNSETNASGNNDPISTEKKLEESEVFVPSSTNNAKEERDDVETNDAADIEHLERSTVVPQEEKIELPNQLRVAEKRIESIPEKIGSDEHLTTTEAPVKYSARKKNGRRSSRRRMSARTKGRKEPVSQMRETTVLPEVKENSETTISPIIQFETEIGELIDGRIFEEPESRTTKELDTRAVGQQDAKYFKSLQEDGKKNAKHNRLDRNGVRESLKSMPSNLGKNQETSESPKVHPVEETTMISIDLSSMKKNDHRNKDETESEDHKRVDEIESEDHKEIDEKEHEDQQKPAEDQVLMEDKAKEEDVLTDENSAEPFKGIVFTEEKKQSFVEKYFVEHHESSEEEVLTVKEEVDEDSEEKPKMVPASVEAEDNSDDKSKQIDGSEELSTDLESSAENYEATDEEPISQEKYSSSKNDDVNSEERSDEYDRSTNSFESTQENSAEDDYVDFESGEDTTVSVERSNSEERSSEMESVEKSEDRSAEKSAEESESALADEKDSTEGVLKFTDELPKNEKKDDATEKSDSNESVEDSVQDYVDDNYEPENYKEQEIPTTSACPNDEEVKKFSLDEEMKSKEETERFDHLFENQRMKAEDKIQSGEEDFSMESKVVKKDRPDSDEDEGEEVESTTMMEDFTTETIMPTTPLPTTTLATTTTKATKRTTTTVRPTPPKLFKPISARRNYNYIPPTTTPNPVVIKPRLPLLNPKPAKPPKSYNDLVPKPVIRRLSLTRKLTSSGTSTTTERETTIQEIEDSTEIPLTTTESSKSEENVLEIKFEPKEYHAARDYEVHKSDQVPNSSYTRTLNSSDDDEAKQPDNPLSHYSFTPYPLIRLSTLATTVDKVSTETEEYRQAETTEATTVKDFEPTRSDPDESVVSATLASDAPQHTEITTDRSVEPEEYQTTMTVMIDGKEVTVVSTELPAESSTIMASSTTVSGNGVDSQSVQPDSVTSTTPRPRKVVGTKRHPSFNCLEKEMYRFYGDTRDCRLFHYCSPGFTSRQVLDFRFVCEEGTIFDEESQSCRHDVQNRKCHKRPW